eukprot:TRINITY_DN121262_c0_g1_i1.p1 TRINITY_DN121262_c0_g1~~TRINITY_DN121262_c0_g1_i1.p1  ORF type:complete len:760 (-),score=126.84 TRINITY_DN121262_c0_g1_i1:307-2505(-)
MKDAGPERIAEKVNEICDVIDSLASVNADGLRSSASDLAALKRSAAALEKLAKAVRAPGRASRGDGRREGEALQKPGLAAVRTRGLLWADRLPPTEQLWLSFAAAALVVALTLPYYVCVTYNSWFVDEGFAIYRNPDARGETPILEVLQHDFWGTHLNPPEGYNTHKSYRPIITLSFAAEWLLAAKLGYGGQEMKPMRLLCCLIHSVNALATLWLLRRLRLPLRWAVLGAALFAAHPVHIENIVYIVGRADALSTTFCLIACHLYLQATLGPQGKVRGIGAVRYGLLSLCTIAAGLCKETGFTIMFFLGCAEVVLRRRWKHVFGLMLCFAAIGAARTWYVGGTEAGFGYVDTPIRYQDAKLTRTLSYLYQHAYHAKLLVLPWHQSWDYSYDALPMVESFIDHRLLAICCTYLAVVALSSYGLAVARKQPNIILGMGLILIPFIPASNLFFLVGTTVGERLLYPCTVGWSLLLPVLVKRSALKSVYSALAVLLVLVYVWNSNIRMSHWRNPSTLFETDAEHWHRSAKVLHSKASELQSRNELQGALDYYLKSLEVFDDQAITDYCIARIYLNLDRFEEAWKRFDKILTGHGIGFHDGNDFLWMTDLGYLMSRMGQHEQGVHYLTEGLNRMAWNCFAWNALGISQLNLGQLEKAMEALLTGLECDPNSVSMWINLAVVYAYGNAQQQASEAMQKATALNATHPAVLHNSQVLQGRAGQGAQPILDYYIPLPGRR